MRIKPNLFSKLAHDRLFKLGVFLLLAFVGFKSFVDYKPPKPQIKWTAQSDASSRDVINIEGMKLDSSWLRSEVVRPRSSIKINDALEECSDRFLVLNKFEIPNRIYEMAFETYGSKLGFKQIEDFQQASFEGPVREAVHPYYFEMSIYVLEEDRGKSRKPAKVIQYFLPICIDDAVSTSRSINSQQLNEFRALYEKKHKP